jgi:hypothetical protein
MRNPVTSSARLSDPYRRPIMSTRRLNASINTDCDSVQSTRPPTYTSNATAVPSYTLDERNQTSAHERVSTWSASLPSASSIVSPDYNAMFDQAASSLIDSVSVTGTSAEITRPAGARYSEFESILGFN